MYKYKDTFGLRYQIGMSPNIELEIDFTENFPFFIRPYHVKEEDKTKVQRKEKVMSLRNYKKGYSAYSKPVMISRKVTNDKKQ